MMFIASDSTDVASLPVRGAWVEMPLRNEKRQ